jgi:hypothetical protein
MQKMTGFVKGDRDVFKDYYAPGGAELCVDDIGLDLHSSPRGKNKGSHQFLNWWQQVSTGHLHCYGFEPVSVPNIKERPSPLFYI